MAERVVQRWEDVIPWWRGPHYRGCALGYDPSVPRGDVAGAIISAAEVVDWDGDGGRDLVVSSWDACHEGVVRLYLDTGAEWEGTPLLAPGPVLDGVMGHASVAREGADFGLLTTSRLRRELHLYRNRGSRAAPRFDAPEPVALDAGWLHEGELIHRAVFADIDGDGHEELVVGTDFWGDYWPDGIEWFEPGYTPYDAAGRWRGGPLRGHLYVFRNRGTPLRPRLEPGEPLRVDGAPLEVYGMAAPAFGDFRGTGRLDLVCGDFLDRLHFLPNLGGGAFGPATPLPGADGGALALDHCIHVPAVADRSGSARADLLLTVEDGYVSLLRNTGRLADGRPVFEAPARLAARAGVIHAGIKPAPAAADWTGDGRIDLMVGDSAGELLFFPNLGERAEPRFGRETRARAGGTPVSLRAGPPGTIQGPAEIRFGYLCPTAVDWDDDGVPDLLLGTVHGEHLFLRCRGVGLPPEFDAPRPLTFDGRPLRTVWRVRPTVADWAGDGRLSYVCLDDDGVLVDFRRAGVTTLADKRPLRFEDGAPVRFTEDHGGGLGRIKLCACDWEGRGTPGLLVGTHARASVPPGPAGAPRHTTGQAAVLWLRNVGEPGAPRFAPPRPLAWRGEPIRLGMHSCTPEAVDWRGLGRPDLLVGAEDGSLLWFRREDLSW